MSAGLKTWHLFNGTIKFGLGFMCISAVNQLKTIRLTNMRLVVDQGVEPDLASVSSDVIVVASGPNTTLVLEDCTFEAAFDSPAHDRLVACMAVEGANVGLVWCTTFCCSLPQHKGCHTVCAGIFSAQLE
jgi:hypothetical protein